MEGRIWIPAFVLALACAPTFACAPAVASPPVRLAPVLPEVTRNLAEGLQDAQNHTPVMARAHAQLILLQNQVTYAVNLDAVPSKQRKDCIECLHSAIYEWENDLNGTMQFLPVNLTDKPELMVRFRPTVTMKNEQVAGYVNWSRTLNAQDDGTVQFKFSADLQIRTKDLEGRTMPHAAMRHAAMHELGHVLGLDDSPNEGDVMGPLDIENPVAAPTRLEIDTVNSLRSQANEILGIVSPAPKN